MTGLPGAQTQIDGVVRPGVLFPFPFRAGQLPFGWYHANGDRYPVESPQGQALSNLPAEYKADWGVEVEDGAVNLPTVFNAAGDGLFPRPVDGSARQVGSTQGDAIRNITGETFTAGQKRKTDSCTGPFTYVLFANGVWSQGSDSNYDRGHTQFDASLVVPTAAENRPVNVGMTMAVYLGV